MKRLAIECVSCLCDLVAHMRKTEPKTADMSDEKITHLIRQAGLQQIMAIEYEFVVMAQGQDSNPIRRKALYYTCPQCGKHETHVPYEVLRCTHCGGENKTYPPINPEGMGIDQPGDEHG